MTVKAWRLTWSTKTKEFLQLSDITDYIIFFHYIQDIPVNNSMWILQALETNNRRYFIWGSRTLIKSSSQRSISISNRNFIQEFKIWASLGLFGCCLISFYAIFNPMFETGIHWIFWIFQLDTIFKLKRTIMVSTMG